MFSGIIRRFAGTASAASIVALAGFSAVGTPAGVSAQVAGACTVAGTATITPGLNVVPTGESASFSGTASNCEGVNVVNGASFSGSISCLLGNVATCVPGGLNFSAVTPYGNCSGALLQQGVLVEAVCAATTPGVVVSVAVFTSDQGTNLPVTSVHFTGAAAGAEG